VSARAPAVERSSTRARLTGRAVILALLVVVFGLAAIYPAKTYLAQRDRIAELQAKVEQLAERNDDLGERIAQLHNPAYLERLARECLGMTRPGEIPFVVVPPDDRADPLPC
jgi:cell division protein FtsB